MQKTNSTKPIHLAQKPTFASRSRVFFLKIDAFMRKHPLYAGCCIREVGAEQKEEESNLLPTLLIIGKCEDDFLASVNSALKLHSQRAETASTGAEALEKLKSGTFLSLAFASSLPDMTAEELTHEIKQTLKLSLSVFHLRSF
ncbi:MAG: hypothetical protein ABIH99_04355 [Candidatus Micrarchaeota archaeon]